MLRFSHEPFKIPDTKYGMQYKNKKKIQNECIETQRELTKKTKLNKTESEKQDNLPGVLPISASQVCVCV